MKWFKIHGERWFMGSTRWELNAEQRAVWVDLLARASINEPPGQIDFYSQEQLAQQFNVDLKLLKSTIKRCVEKKKLKVSEKKQKISIINWKKYQSEYQRQKPYREQHKSQSKVTKMEDNSCNKVTLRKEGEEKRLEIEKKENKEDEKREESLTPNNNSFKSPLPSNSNTFTEGKITIKEQFLSMLREYKGYPFNEAQDSLLFSITVKEFPNINITQQTARKIAWWKEHPDALKANPKKQLQDWFKKEYEFQKRGGPQQIGEVMQGIVDSDHANFVKECVGLGASKKKKGVIIE